MLKPRIFPAVERLSRFALNRRGMISRTVSTRALDLHVYDGLGRGTLPTVVMLHGLGAAGGSFGRVGPATQTTCRTSRSIVSSSRVAITRIRPGDSGRAMSASG